MSLIERCTRHKLDYVTGYCLKCETEFRESGRYQHFLDEALRRSPDGLWLLEGTVREFEEERQK